MADRVSILCVDDDDSVRHLIQLSLSADPDLDVKCVRDASQALQLLNERSWVPDCVLTDIRMPGMNGVDLLLALRREAFDHDISVIVMTAAISTDAAERYLALGARGIIEKPFDVSKLPAQVRTFCCDHGMGASLPIQSALPN